MSLKWSVIRMRVTFLYIFSCLHLFNVCVCGCVCEHASRVRVYAHAMVLLWGSEDNFRQMVLSFLHMGPRDQIHVTRLVRAPLPAEPSQQPLECIFSRGRSSCKWMDTEVGENVATGHLGRTSQCWEGWSAYKLFKGPQPWGPIGVSSELRTSFLGTAYSASEPRFLVLHTAPHL